MRQSEEEFQLLIEGMQDAAISILSPKGYVAAWNSGAEPIEGYKTDEIMGKHFSCFFLPEAVALGEPSRELLTALELGSTEDVGWRVRNDGRQFWAHVVTTALFDKHGGLRGFAQVVRDLTERRGAERALSDKNIELQNATAANLTERSGAERALSDKNIELQNATAANLTERRGAERALSDKDIELRTATAANLTERSGAERASSDKSIELQNALEAKVRFLATMSHELRTPLNHVIGFTEFLVDGKPGPVNRKQKEYLEDVLDSGNRLLQLINDVLEVAKVKAGKSKLNPERFSLHMAIGEVCGMVKPIADKKNVQVDIDVAPELGEVTLDRREFKQALYNLLSNAIKFSAGGARVKILAMMHREHSFKVAIRDTGIGIKSEDIPRLFRPFEQLESGTTRRYEGMGLGLILTQKIVELQGGTINVESDVVQGSCFTIVLPLVLAEPTFDS